MNIIELFRLLKKHIVILLITPLLMAVLVFYLTRKPVLIYSSQTTLYTGIASGSSVDLEKKVSFFATNTAFDNLINVIKSRESQQEVAIRLLALHLMLDKPINRYISRQSFANIKRITPKYINNLVAKSKTSDFQKNRNPDSASLISKEDTNTSQDSIKKSLEADSTYLNEEFSFNDLNETDDNNGLPSNINLDDFELTVQNLKKLKESSDTNFVYKLLNYGHPHYSINAISKISVRRIGNSDLVSLGFESNDPGICRQTLLFMTDVCIKNYKFVKENRTDAVVKYFEHQVKQAAIRLRIGEDKLLKFNMDHNIINYYEQSKAVAIVKENLEVSYHDMRIRVAGAMAAIKRIEEKLNNQKQIQLNNSIIIENRKKLAEVNSKIATIETISIAGQNDTSNNKELVRLKLAAENLKDELRTSVNSLYNITNSTEGIHISNLLSDWLKNVVEYEQDKAGLNVLGDRIIDFQKQYAIYAPAGANIKRIEREINVSEQEFLELLHGLNMAKLKMQDAELSSSIKAVDPPYFPLSANPTKRSLLIMVAAIFGFILVLAVIIALEYFDNSFKNIQKAERILQLKNIGIFPKVFLNTGSLNFPYVANRLLEIIIQNISIKPENAKSGPQTLVFFSTLKYEGKSMLLSNIAQKLLKQGKSVLVMNYSAESLRKNEISQIGYRNDVNEDNNSLSIDNIRNKRTSFPFLSRILGYPDPRIDFESPFLANADDVLSKDTYIQYEVNENFYNARTYHDLLNDNQLISSAFDYVLIEIPSLISNSFPDSLLKSSTPILVARANHVWSDADKNALKSAMNFLADAPDFILNGVDLPVVETLLGDLPKKRSRIRRILKKLLRLQFLSGYQP